MTSDFRPQSAFLTVLVERGFLHQCSDLAGLDQVAKSGDLVAYIGFDCTAPSLHAGSLVQIMLLRWLQKTGGKPIALMGGGTTRVGDPSGKDASRQLLRLETIAANKDGIKNVFAKFLSFGDGKRDAIMPDNADWLATLNYIDFLRDVGRHFSVNRMLSLDSVKLRLERDQELSFLEFNYMCLQAYDFVELFKRHGCQLQMGGSDQWGNIVTGIDLGRRMGTSQLYGLTSPLLTSASGAKMGKTAQGAVWLDESRLPVFDYWQYWRNCEDRDTVRFLKLFTELRLDEIAETRSAGRRRNQRGEEDSRHRGNSHGAWARGGVAGSRRGAEDLRGRCACGKPAERRNPRRRDRGGAWGAHGFRQIGARRFDRRGAASNHRRRPEDQ